MGSSSVRCGTVQFSQNFDSMGETGTTVPAGYLVGPNAPDTTTVAVLDVTPGSAYSQTNFLGNLYNVGIVGALPDRSLSVVSMATLPRTARRSPTRWSRSSADGTPARR